MKRVTPYGPRPLTPAEQARRTGDRYLAWLGIVLLGYALFSRSFAYLGVPPVFVGEITLGLGLWALWRDGALRPVLRLGAARGLLVLMAWGLACTLPYLPRYGLDAPRDYMLLGYGVFAFVVAALVVKYPDRLRGLLVRYRTFAWVFLGLVWAVYLLNNLFEGALPTIPGTDVPLVEAKGGDMLVHLAGITAFLVVGMTRQRALLIALLALNVGLVVVSNRGGMVAYGLAGLVLLALKPPERKVTRLAVGFVVLLALAALAGSVLTIKSGRAISVEQLWLNVTSLFGGGSGLGALEGTKTWRLEWWGRIVGYTFGGEYFWTGKGFGVNLAESDGFAMGQATPLRSPHNGHLTILARAGVPGLALWVLVQGTWLVTMLRGWGRARLMRDGAWTGLYAFVVAYWVAFHVNASFDVYLEGPMGGIWFWCVFGLGLGMAVLHRHAPAAVYDTPRSETRAPGARPRPHHLGAATRPRHVPPDQPTAADAGVAFAAASGDLVRRMPPP